MSSSSIEKATPENCFSTEAIDLLLLLEQELPKYIKDNNYDTAKTIINTTKALQIGADQLDLDSISEVADSLNGMFNYCLNTKLTNDNTIAEYLTDVLESLQVLLMGYLMGSSIEENKIVTHTKSIVANFNQYIQDTQEAKNSVDLVDDNSDTKNSENQTISDSVNIESVDNQISTIENREIIEIDSNKIELADSGGNTTETKNLIIKDDLESDKVIASNNQPDNCNSIDPLNSTIIPSSSSTVDTENILQQKNEAEQLEQRNLLLTKILGAIQENTTLESEYNSLAQLNNFVNTLTANSNLQVETDKSQQKTIKTLSRRLKKIQLLLNGITTWSKQLTENASDATITKSYTNLLTDTAESVINEISELADTVDLLQTNRKKSGCQIYEQQKLLNSSSSVLKTVNNICFQDILEPLQNIWTQLQTRHHKSVTLNIIDPHLTIEKRLAKIISSILLYFCWYLLEESVKYETRINNSSTEETAKITINNYKKSNNLIINISYDGRSLLLQPDTLVDNSIPCSNKLNNQGSEPALSCLSERFLGEETLSEGILKDTASHISFGAAESHHVYKSASPGVSPSVDGGGGVISDLFSVSNIVANSKTSLFNGNSINLTEIQQQLDNLQGTLNISYNPQVGTNINITIPLEEETKELIFFKVGGRICAFLLSSVKQIILPQNVKITVTKIGKELILSKSPERKIPIIQIKKILSQLSCLPDEFKTIQDDNQNIDNLEHIYIIVGNSQKYAVEIDSFIGRKNSTISYLNSSISLPNYIVGTTIYDEEDLILILDGSLLVLEEL